MCRFVAYLGDAPVLMSEVLVKPANSLINQSMRSRLGLHDTNADGFGFSWYNRAVSNEPGIFRSVLPAWNDENLQYLARTVRSHCFLGHVRASTYGGANFYNCHPFIRGPLSFVHNGTIGGFHLIRRELMNHLDQVSFESIKGQTDSEHFFALLNTIHHAHHTEYGLEEMASTMMETFRIIKHLLNQHDISTVTRLNTVLTNGKEMVITRYLSDLAEPPLSLYYAIGKTIDITPSQQLMQTTETNPTAILIASEPLNDYATEWQEIPLNHMFTVNQQFETTLTAIPL